MSKSSNSEIAVLQSQVEEIKEDVANVSAKTDNIYTFLLGFEDKLEKRFVTKDQFQPVRAIAYGLTAAVMGIVVTAIVKGVIK